MIMVFFDFLCPFAWRGLELAEVLRQEQGFVFEPLHFSLEQFNHPDNAQDRFAPVWKATAQPHSEMKGLLALLGSQAACQQGKAQQWQFILHLFRLHHQDRQSLQSLDTLRLAAERAGLDLPRFEYDLLQNEAQLREELEHDLHDACRLRVFGTPTFVLEDGHAAYLRFRKLPEGAQASLDLWNLYATVLQDGAEIETIKRPR